MTAGDRKSCEPDWRSGLPPPSWRIFAAEALDRWYEGADPAPGQREAVLVWLLDLSENGPPDGAIPIPLREDLYLARVEGAQVIIEFLALMHERRAVIREIRAD